MNKRLTISIDLMQPHVAPTPADLEEGYRALAQDEQDAAEALKWNEGTIEHETKMLIHCCPKRDRFFRLSVLS